MIPLYQLPFPLQTERSCSFIWMCLFVHVDLHWTICHWKRVKPPIGPRSSSSAIVNPPGSFLCWEVALYVQHLLCRLLAVCAYRTAAEQRHFISSKLLLKTRAGQQRPSRRCGCFRGADSIRLLNSLAVSARAVLL